MGNKGDKTAARPPEGSLVETRCLKGPKSTIVPFAEPHSGPKSKTGSGVWIVVAASHQTRLDTRSKARGPIKVEIKGEGGRERDDWFGLLGFIAYQPL